MTKQNNMNWKLIFGLSLFGLAMAFATVSLITSNIEPICWLAIFLICAYLIAKNAPGKYFLHGLLVSIVNCIWVTGVHIMQSGAYMANHAKEVEGYTKMNTQFGLSVTQSMLAIGPFVGIFSGIVLGLFAIIASKIFKKQPAMGPMP